MTFKELKELDEKKLRQRLTELRASILEKRFGLVNGQEKRVRDIRKARKEIAQILTVMNTGVMKSVEAKDTSKEEAVIKKQ